MSDQRKELVITIHAMLDGFAVDLNFTGAMDTLPVALQRLRELGGEPTSWNSSKIEQPARKPAQRTTPAYDGNGTALCPVHRRELKEGKWGMYCSARDQETGEYCKLKFTE